MNPLIPVLTTERLILRPFEMTDLAAVYHILDVENQELPRPRAERAQFLAWTVQNYHTLARLNLPPYGERAVVERQSGAVIGSVGLVPPTVRSVCCPVFPMRFRRNAGIISGRNSDCLLPFPPLTGERGMPARPAGRWPIICFET